MKYLKLPGKTYVILLTKHKNFAIISLGETEVEPIYTSNYSYKGAHE